MEQPHVRLWVKYETFVIGVLQIPPPSKFSMHYLRKMATYVRTKGDGGYPCLSWPMWRHIACGKLQLAENLAWLYFETFDILLERTAEERLQWAEEVSHCKSEEEIDKLKNKARVFCLWFPNIYLVVEIIVLHFSSKHRTFHHRISWWISSRNKCMTCGLLVDFTNNLLERHLKLYILLESVNAFRSALS